MTALLLALLPTMSHAEAGDVGSLAVVVLAVYLAIWVAVTVAVFLFLRRRLPMPKRLACTVLFFFLPALLLGGALLKDYALDGYSDRAEITTKPLEVLGVTFPPGSHAVYDGAGGFFGWGAKRTLQSIHSPHPVLLGNVPIDGLIFIPENCCERARAEVSAGSIVDGWPCGDAVFDITPAGPALRSCFLAAPLTSHGKEWPAGSYVDLTTPPIAHDAK